MGATNAARSLKAIAGALLAACAIALCAALPGQAWAATDAASLQAELNVGGAVELASDIALEDTVTIPAGVTVTLDLKGKSISQSKACTGSYSMIVNKGSLTIKDSVSGGKISFTDTGAGDSSFGWGAYTLENRGTLVVNSGTVENLSNHNSGGTAVHMYCAIQQAVGSTTINGGTISTPTYRSVRINAGALAITGGTFEGQVWLQPNQGDASIAVSGGTFAPSANIDASSIFMTNVGEGHTVSSASFTDGTFNGKIGCSDSSSAALVGCVTGGTFNAAAKANTPASLLGGNTGFVENPDGSFELADKSVASVNGVKHLNLQEAVDAAASGDTVTLLSDVNLTEAVVVAAGNNITLDLNGKTISGVSSAAKGSAVIVNKGSLTITDSAEGGKITSSAEQPDVDYGIEGFPTYANNTISNYGTLKLEKGTIENATEASKGAFYAIDNYNDGDVVINGGKVTCENNFAIRQFANGSTSNTVTVNGGEIKGTRAVWMQLPGSSTSDAPAASLTVNGGTLTSTDSVYNLAVYVYSYGNSGANASVSVTGGTVNGNIALNGTVTGTMKEKSVSVTGGTITGQYGVYSYGEDEVANPVISITGGTFATDYSESYAKDDGYVFAANNDGTYGVVEPNNAGGTTGGGEGDNAGSTAAGGESASGSDGKQEASKAPIAQTGDAVPFVAVFATMIFAIAVAFGVRRYAL